MKGSRLLQALRRLEGSTLETITGAHFTVDSVSEDGTVTVMPHSTKKYRRIPVKELEAAYHLQLQGKDLRPSTVRNAGASEANPAYVTAIIRAVQE